MDERIYGLHLRVYAHVPTQGDSLDKSLFLALQYIRAVEQHL